MNEKMKDLFVASFIIFLIVVFQKVKLKKFKDRVDNAVKQKCGDYR